mgnify:FL=1
MVLVRAQNKSLINSAYETNEKLPEKIPLNERSIKLNCAPVINLFPKTSEPIPISNKEYRHKLSMDRQRPDDYEIYRVEKVFSIDSRGQQRELVPYFSPALSEDVDGKYGWISQFEESYHRKNQGNDVWLSFLMQLMSAMPRRVKRSLQKHCVVIILYVNLCP